MRKKYESPAANAIVVEFEAICAASVGGGNIGYEEEDVIEGGDLSDVFDDF